MDGPDGVTGCKSAHGPRHDRQTDEESYDPSAYRGEAAALRGGAPLATVDVKNASLYKITDASAVLV